MKLRNLLRPDWELIHAQRMLIEMLRAEIRDLHRAGLEGVRSNLQLAIAARVLQETPEVDVREDLDMLIRDLSDQIARLEEQIV